MDKTAKYGIYLLMLIALSIGEIEEIRSQKIYMGDMIQQYAVITYIQDGATYNDLCPDCICSLDVRDSQNRLIIDDASTEEITKGLFTYVTSPGEFSALSTYYAVFNCSSPTYADGLAFSQVDILGTPPGTSSFKPVADSTSTPESNPISDGLDSLIGENPFSKSIKNLLTGLTTALGNLFDFSSYIGESFSNTLSSVFSFGVAIFSEFMGNVVLIFSGQPSQGASGFFWMFWKYFKPLIIVMTAPIILYEFYVMSFKASGLPFNQAVTEILEAQKRIYYFFSGIADEGIRYINVLIEWVMVFVRVFKPGGT